MKVVIVGGNSSVALALQKVIPSDFEVITVGRTNCDIIFDLRDQELILPMGVDIVILTAAHFGGPNISDLIDAENVNVMGSLKVCEAAWKSGVKHFVLISSIFVLLEKEFQANSIYSLTKKHSEDVVKLFCQSTSMPLTILRPSQIYGEISAFSQRQPFLSFILDQAQKGEPVNIYGSRDPKINIIHIDDLAQIIWRTIKMKVLGTFACLQTRDISYGEFAKTAFEVFGNPILINFLSEKYDIADNVFESDFELYKIIGFSPQVDLCDGIRRIADKRISNL